MLQYTSGSTSEPRGIVLTHANLLHNLGMLRGFQAAPSPMVMLHWLPLHHDMGLIRGMLSPLHAGADCFMMSPTDFVEKPVRWLAAISKHRATITGAPNFGYELCVRKVTDAQIDELDLSTLKIAYCSSEPIRKATVERFLQRFASCGLARTAFRASYGLAEATVMVAGEVREGPHYQTVSSILLRAGHIAPPVGTDDRVDLVCCGQPLGGQQVAILDEHGAPCAADAIGEVCVRGASVGQGYWDRSTQTASTFGDWLRTGDLGWLSPTHDLYITGRKKDVIIVRGQNYFPQDLEATVEMAARAVRPGCVAAFGIDGDDGERVVVIAECVDQQPWTEISEAIRSGIATYHGVALAAVVLVAPGEIPKTASGKVQRGRARQLYLDGAFAQLHAWVRPRVSDEVS
jgi:acyl-CoA synthetase (AMP-forming)/AMP-acid ligase II